MSGIVGIYQRDGAPVSPRQLDGLLDAVAYRGPDARTRWSEGAVGLGHALFSTTPESLGEQQPLEDESGLLCLAFDGRIDNREDLQAALLAHGAGLRSQTDAELVLAAYACWGADCPQRLIGDFAFALWDGRSRSLFCARDILGIRPFYYILEGRRFLFSSDISALVRFPEYSRAPNLGMLGEYLSDSIVSLSDTLYRDIQRLPPAHCLTVHEGRTDLRRYFNLDPNKTIYYRADRDYAEHFLTIFQEALRCHLRSHTPVALFFSGGLDSSAIFSLAQRMGRNGTLPVGSLTPYFLAFSHPEADEQSYVEELLKHWNSQARSVPASGWTSVPLDEQIRRCCDLPDMPNTPPWEILCAKVRSQGCNVILDGFGGDEWLTGHSAHCADMIKHGRILSAWRQVREDIAVSNQWGGGGVDAMDPLRWCLFPLIPRSLKNRLKRRLRWDVPRWIAPSFAKAIDLQERLLDRPVPPPFPTLAQQEIHGQLTSGWGTVEFELVSRFDAQQALESRHPLCDRRLIEFAFALPEEQRWRGGQTKYVLRQAMQGLFPDLLLARRSKADFSYLFRDCIAKERTGRPLPGSYLAASGFLDRSQTEALYRNCTDGATAMLGPAWMILATERWYGTMFG